MVVPGNDLKGFCRSALISAKSDSGGGTGTDGGYLVKTSLSPSEPWSYPSEWVPRVWPESKQAIFVIRSVEGQSLTFNFRYFRYFPSTSKTYVSSVDWGDGTTSDIKKISYGKIYTLSHTYTEETGYLVTDKNGEQYYQWIVKFSSFYEDEAFDGVLCGVGYDGCEVQFSHFSEDFVINNSVRLNPTTSGITTVFVNNNYLESIEISEIPSDFVRNCEKLYNIKYNNVGRETGTGDIFENCQSLKTLPEINFKTLKSGSFIDIPIEFLIINDIETIEENAFVRCNNLKLVLIPSSCSVSDKAFSACNINNTLIIE